MVKQACGTTPCIIGGKLKTSYHRGAEVPYLEIAVDISSNTTAASVTNFVAGYMSGLSIHLGFLLEGKTAAELPEQLLGEGQGLRGEDSGVKGWDRGLGSRDGRGRAEAAA